MSKGKSKKITHVAIVLDESGSMGRYAQQTVDGFNEQIQTLRATAGAEHAVDVTFIKFSADAYEVFARMPVHAVPVLRLHSGIVSGQTNWDAGPEQKVAGDEYYPSGSTALRLGIRRAVEALIRDVKDTDDTAYLVLALTDGEENSSGERCPVRVLRELIERMQATNKWTFTLQGANVDLARLTEETAIPMGNVMAYQANAAGMTASSGARREASVRYMTDRQEGAAASASFYNPPMPSAPNPNATAAPNLNVVESDVTKKK